MHASDPVPRRDASIEPAIAIPHDDGRCLGTVLVMAPAGALTTAPHVETDESAFGLGDLPDVVDLDGAPGADVQALAPAEGVQPSRICVAVPDRPRHAAVTAACRATGAGVQPHGDIAGVISTARVEGVPVDLDVGSGGASGPNIAVPAHLGTADP